MPERALIYPAIITVTERQSPNYSERPIRSVTSPAIHAFCDLEGLRRNNFITSARILFEIISGFRPL
jgi:hypothetical protein